MAILTIENPPWCAGRDYCNATAPSKVWCYRRPPPHFWQTQLNGFEGAWEFLNDVHTYQYSQVTTGHRSVLTWFMQIEDKPPEDFKVVWTPNIEAGFITGYFLVVQFLWPTISHRISFARFFEDPITNWSVVSALPMPEIERGPMFAGGDDLFCAVRIGDYSNTPAHSCRGDYNGEWP